MVSCPVLTRDGEMPATCPWVEASPQSSICNLTLPPVTSTSSSNSSASPGLVWILAHKSLPALPSDSISMSRYAKEDGTNLETWTSKSKVMSPACKGQAAPRKSTCPVPAGRAHFEAPHKSPWQRCMVTPAGFTFTSKDPSAAVVSRCPDPLTTVLCPCLTADGEMPATWPWVEASPQSSIAKLMVPAATPTRAAVVARNILMDEVATIQTK